MEALFENNLIVEILKLGITGVAFVFLYMSFKLLKGEQSKDSPRPTFLKAINRFNWMALVFILIVGGFSITEMILSSEHETTMNEPCLDGIERLKEIIQVTDDPDVIKQAVRNSLQPCELVDDAGSTSH